jgi:periplasmic protein CpxP/Spy
MMPLSRRTLAALSWLLVAAPIAAQQSVQRVPERVRLEGEIRRDFARLVRQRVGLSDGQMRLLGPITQKFEGQRRQLQLEERQTRLSIQAATRATQADSTAVSRLLQQLIEVEKRRVGLLEAEQRELAAIMSPVQRARYMALQEQARRRLEQMRQRRLPGAQNGAGAGRARPPG